MAFITNIVLYSKNQSSKFSGFTFAYFFIYLLSLKERFIRINLNKSVKMFVFRNLLLRLLLLLRFRSLSRLLYCLLLFSLRFRLLLDSLRLTTVDPDDNMPWDFDNARKREKALQLLRDQSPMLLVGLSDASGLEMAMVQIFMSKYIRQCA